MREDKARGRIRAVFESEYQSPSPDLDWRLRAALLHAPTKLMRPHWPLELAAALLALVIVLGLIAPHILPFASHSTLAKPRPSLPPPKPPTAALVAWRDFPANGNPRPIIVFDRTVEHIGPAGFTAEPDRKLDWGCNKFVFAPGVAPPATASGSATAEGASYPALGAVEAYSELMAARAPFAYQAPRCATARPFVIKDVRWQVAGFPTDRGTVQMSAWIFDIGEIDAYLGYSALDPSAFWRNGVSPEGVAAGRISPDGLTLTLGTVGGPETPGPCGEDLSASTAESDTAVAVAIATQIHTPPAGDFCTTEGHVRTITVRLARPLGGRVLVDAKGNAGAVCVEGTC